jgi:hypothetical protein
MEPIDKRITAAQLMTLRGEPNAAAKITALLLVNEMPPTLGKRTRTEIEKFLIVGDAVMAAQLIHAAIVRRQRASARSATSRLENDLNG